MSKKVRFGSPTELAAPPPIVFDKSYMICLRSADGKLFLVDRNCAMVSGVIRGSVRRKSYNTETTTTSMATIPETCEMTNIGNENYETVVLDEINGDLLELALEAMYFKCRYDGDPEKRPLEPPHAPEDRHKLAALSVLLDM